MLKSPKEMHNNRSGRWRVGESDAGERCCIGVGQVEVSDVVPLAGTVAAPKALEIVGGAMAGVVHNGRVMVS